MLTVMRALEYMKEIGTYILSVTKGFPHGTVVKNLPFPMQKTQETWVIPGSGRFLGVGNGKPLVFLPEKCHGQGSLVGYRIWGCKE